MILGISGKARSGKDTFAGMLAKELQKQTGRAYVLMAFAYELKTKVQRDFDLSYEQLWGDEKETYDFRYPKVRGALPFCAGNRDDGRGLEALEDRQHWTSREILQDYGQFFRTIDNDFWVKELFKTIEEKEYKNVIITDVRHINEVDVVVDRGGYHIRVERDSSKDTVHNHQHISETALDAGHRVDVTVKNYGTLEDLKDTAKTAVKFLLESEKAFKKFK